MKYLIFTIIVFINGERLVAQNSKFDTLINTTWLGGAWQNYSRTINDYDADCRLTTSLHQNWNSTSGKWINNSISTYSYVSGNYTDQILNEVWLNNSWTNSDRLTYTYDVSFKVLSTVEQTWSVDHWSDHISTINKYNNDGYADSIVVQLSYEDHPLENSSLTLNSFNNDGTLQQTIKKNWNKATSSWVDYSKNSFAYNDYKQVYTDIAALWNNSAASWQFQTRTEYGYINAEKLYSILIRDWQTNKWIDQSLYTNSYDKNGFLSNVLVQRFDGFDFEKYTQTNYKNNSDGNISQHATQFWDEALNAWINNTQETYSYSASCLLPLKLLLFTATKNNDTVSLNWNTTDEINIAHFTIQRNPDSTDFTSLGDVPGKNGTGINAYTYTDDIKNIKADTIYYRLKITDKDGITTYSKIVPVDLSANVSGGGLKVYPNPAKDHLFVSFTMQNTTKAELFIIDALGKIVYSNTVNDNQGNNITSINISSLSKGIYYVSVVTDKDVQRTKFAKQ